MTPITRAGNGSAASSDYGDHTYDYSMNTNDKLTLAENIVYNNAQDTYLGGEWKITSGSDVISFAKGANTKPSDSKEQKTIEVVSSGKSGDAVVTYTYYNNQYTDSFAIHVKGYNVHFNLNGGSGKTPADAAVSTDTGAAMVQMPSADGISKSGCQFLGWSLYKDNMTKTGRHGWYRYTNPDAAIYSASDNVAVQSNWPEELTFYAMWARTSGATDKIGMFIRKDGVIQTEPAGYDSSNYYTVTPGTGTVTSAVKYVSCDITQYISIELTERDLNKIEANLTAKFHSDVEAENVSIHKKTGQWLWDPSTQYVQWYIIKDQSSDWHIDGCVRGKADNQVSLDYLNDDSIYPGVTGQAPEGRDDYKKGQEVTVKGKNTLSRTGYDFAGWDIKPNGTGIRYQEGSKITLNEKQTRLYAQWVPKNNTNYTIVYYDADTEAELSKKVNSGTTGKKAKVKDEDKTLEGYKFVEDDSRNVLEAEILPDGSTVLKLYFEKGHSISITAGNIDKLYDGKEVGLNDVAYTLIVDGAEGTGEAVSGGFKVNIDGREYTVTGVNPKITLDGKDAKAVDAGNYVVDLGDASSVNVKNPKGKDANISVSLTNGSIRIAKRDITATSATGDIEYDGKKHKGDELNPPVTVTGDGFVDGDEPQWSFTAEFKAPGGTPGNNVFDYKKSDKLDANYNINLVPGTLTITAAGVKYEISVVANSFEEKYDGKEHKASTDGFELKGVDSTSEGKQSPLARLGVFSRVDKTKFKIGDEEFTISGIYVEGSGTDAGSYDILVKQNGLKIEADGADVTEQFAIKTVDGKLTINKRSVILKSSSLAKVWDGTPLKNPEGKLTGLKDDAPVKVIEDGSVGGDGWADGDSAAYTFTGKQKKSGQSDNSFTYELEEKIAKNYDIQTVFGKLSVTKSEKPVEISVVPKSGEETYDGNSHTVSGFKNEDNGKFKGSDGKYYEVRGIEARAEGTDVGDYAVSVTTNESEYGVFDEEGDNVIDDVVVTIKKDAKLVIKKRTVTLTSASLSKPYDGKALTNPDDKLITSVPKDSKIKLDAQGVVEGFVGSDSATVKFTGSQTIKGESENTFTYEINGNANNYEVAKTEGTLTVTSRTGEGGDGAFTVNLTVNSGEFKYDGEKHTVSGFVEDEDGDGSIPVTINGETYTVTGLSAGKDATHVSESGDIEATGTAKVEDAEGNNVTDQFTVNVTKGNITITKRSVSIKSASLSKKYKANEVLANKGNKIESESADGVTIVEQGKIGGDGFASGDEPVWNFTGKLKAPGTAQNTFESVGNKLEALKADYDITVEYGILTVEGADTQYEISAYPVPVTVNYDGKEHSIDKDNFTIGGAVESEEELSFFQKTGDFFTKTETKKFDIDGETFTLTGLSATGKGTNAGEYTISLEGTETITDSDGNDVTGQFVVHKNTGKLTINKLDVILQSATLSKVYDGDELKNPEGKLEVDSSKLPEGTTLFSNGSAAGFIEGEGIESVTFDASVSEPGETKPNTYNYVLKGNTSIDNYNITENQGTISITSRPDDAKYEVTVIPEGISSENPDGSGTNINPEGAVFKYDGTEHSVSGFAGQTDKGIPVTAGGKIYYVTGLEAAASLTDAGETNVVVTGKAVVSNEAGKDVTSEFIVKYGSAKLKVTKREVVINAASLSKPYDGKALQNPEGKLEIGDEDLAEGMIVKNQGSITGDGFVEGQGATYTFTGSRTLVGHTPNEISYTLNDGTNADNYDIQTNNGDLEIKNRDAKYEISVTGNTSTEPVYDGEEHGVSGFVGEDEEGKIPVIIGDETYYVTDITSEATGTDAGEYPSTIEGTPKVTDKDGNDVTDQFDVSVIPGKLVINKAKVELRSADLTKAYDGKALANGDTKLAIETGWAPGEGATYSFTGSQTIVGNSANAFGYTLNGNTKESNYDITKSEGTLTVTNRSEGDLLKINVTAKSKTKEYDGTEHHVSGFENETDKGIQVTVDGETYYVNGLTSEAASKDATGDNGIATTITGTPVVTDASGNDVTAQFDVIPKPGTLVITKKALTLVSKDLSKQYDGMPLTNGNEPLATEDGWAEGDGATYNFTGSRTIVGVTGEGNTFDIAPNDGTNLDNYNISKIAGSLTVISRDAKYEVTIHGKSLNEKYDGKEHEVSGFVEENADGKVEVSVDGNTYYIGGMTSYRKGTNASDSGMTKVDGTPVVTDTEGNVVSDEFAVTAEPGEFTIGKRDLTLSSADLEKVYDGEPLLGGGEVTIGGDGLAEGENLEFEFTGSQTLVGESENSFNYTFILGQSQKPQDSPTGFIKRLSDIFGPRMVVHAAENEVVGTKLGDVSNYNITVIPGTLKVTPSGDGGEVDPSKVFNKTHEDGIYKIGDEVVFTLTATNIYADARTITFVEQDGVTVDQAVFEGVAGGDSVSTTAHYTMTEADSIAGTYKNTASAVISDGETPGGTYTGEDEVIPERSEPSIAVIKKLTGINDKAASDSSVLPRIGDEITYTIAVINNGNVSVNNIEVKDELTGDSWTLESLNAGATDDTTCVAKYTVTEADVQKGSVTNKATASGKDGNGNDITGSGETTDKVSQTFNLTIHYTTQDEKTTLAGDYNGSYKYDSNFFIATPSVSGYTAEYSNVSGKMPAQNLELYVHYAPNESVVEYHDSIAPPTNNTTNNTTNNYYNTTNNDSTINNYEDDDDNSGSGSGSNSGSGNSGNSNSGSTRSNTTSNRTNRGTNNTASAPAAEPAANATPQVTNDQVAASSNRVRRSGQTPYGESGATVEIDKDGNPTLVSASDTETPLMNLGLGDHACNVLRFLILLAAFGVAAAHTNAMKKHQSRIFELKEKLEEEERRRN